MSLQGMLQAPCASDTFNRIPGSSCPEAFSNDLLALDDCRLLSGFRSCLPCAKFIYKQILPSLYLALISASNF